MGHVFKKLFYNDASVSRAEFNSLHRPRRPRIWSNCNDEIEAENRTLFGAWHAKNCTWSTVLGSSRALNRSWIGKRTSRAPARPVDLSNQKDTTRRVCWLIMCYSGQRRAQHVEKKFSNPNRVKTMLWMFLYKSTNKHFSYTYRQCVCVLHFTVCL